MKKIYVAAALLAMGTYSNAQILLSEDFQGDLSNIQISYPSAATTDASWYTFDEDGFADGSGGSRPGEWFALLPFATVDSLTPGGDTNVALGANSWFTSPQVSKNWLITPSIAIPAGATGTVLKFKSASRQTPLYLDGYKVLISNSDNDLLSFSSTPLYTAAEFTGPGNMGGDFAAYTFAPSGAWVQGWDGSTIQTAEVEFDGDSARFIGVLTEKTISLGAYAGQTVFIAFLHESDDDNLISVDDIMVDATTGIGGYNTVTSVNAYPNPTVDQVVIAINATDASAATVITVTDIFGRIVHTETAGMMNVGANKFTVDASSYENGTYNVEIRSEKGVAKTSFVKK
jgi:hypothetical protein